MPNPRQYYVDTSAYLAMLLGQEGAIELERELKGGRLVSSVLLVIETTRNLIRLTRAGLLATDQYQKCLDRLAADREMMMLRDLTMDVCDRPEMPVVSIPRTLDLAHLRTARWFHEREPLTRFVSLDVDQEQAAKEIGLPV